MDKNNTIHPLFLYLIEKGGFDEETDNWLTLAKEFDIGTHHPDTPIGRKRQADVAKARWYRSPFSKMDLKNVTLGKDGQPISKRYGQKTIPKDVEKYLEGAEITGGTTNVHGGGAWLRFKYIKTYGLTPDEATKAAELIGKSKFKVKEVKGSGVGVADLSDLHTGSVLKYAIETVKTLPFDIEILTDYMDNAISIINSYKFAKVYLFLPGDLVETFTAFNHRDTWRHVQANQTGVVIMAYELLKRLFENVKNLEKIYMVEGNHDRMVSAKEGNSRKGVAELLAYFLSQNSSLNINYHPWLIGDEIDGCYHICTHGDHKPFLKNDFWFRYGRQGVYNVLRTGHYHGFNVLRQTNENLHYQCPSVFPGNFFSESIGFDAVPAITITTHENGVPRIDYRPLTTAKNVLQHNTTNG